MMKRHIDKNKFIIAIISLIFAGIMVTCLDPFSLPDVSNGILVVEGTFTDVSEENRIKLTFAGQVNKRATPVKGASVTISDNLGNSGLYQEADSGVYEPVSADFQGIEGRTYVLRIELMDGRVYQSDSTLFRQPPQIENLRYEPVQSPSPDGKEWLYGVEFYIDTWDSSNENRYFLWKYKEVWETFMPNPIRDIYLGDGEFEEVINKSRCFLSETSRDIMIKSTAELSQSEIWDHPITFVDNTTSRLWREYRIIVTQFSLSEEAFLHHEKLLEITGQNGTIFDKQPFTLRGNIRNINDPSEIVMGYFLVSGVSKRSLQLSVRDLPKEYWGVYSLQEYCKFFTRIYNVSLTTDFDRLFNKQVPRWGLDFIGRIYDEESFDPEPPIIALEFAPTECTTCSGTLEKLIDWDAWD